ncbi:MAG: nucleoside 2-deoxyribosyltransferase [Candidatus ainarchaeum sp.]|nr:nucleoside 2-deoxyribosyltransferase [Candidatus ainarchaeum sp.]
MDKFLLKEKLKMLSKALENQGNKTKVFFRDVQNWGDTQVKQEEILPKAYEMIKESDAIFAFVDVGEKSEGQLLEIGFAKAKGKKIVLAIKDGLGYKFLRMIADEVIEFENLDDLINQINAL